MSTYMKKKKHGRERERERERLVRVLIDFIEFCTLKLKIIQMRLCLTKALGLKEANSRSPLLR